MIQTRHNLKPFYVKSHRIIFSKIGVLSLIWVSFAYTIVQCPTLIGKGILLFALGFFVNGLIQLGHEAWHYLLFKKAWQNRVFGHLLGLVFGITFEPSRHAHLLHHRHNRTPQDPDAYNVGKKSLKLTLLYYSVIFFGVPLSIVHFNILYPLAYFSRDQQRQHWKIVALMILFYFGLASFIFYFSLQDIALQGWILPVIFSSPWNGLKSVSDHYANAWQGSPLKSATTVRSNAWVNYFWNGLNYHLDHHLFPGVPGYRLRDLHELVRPELEKNQAPLFNSYLYVWYRALKEGPQHDPL